MFKFLIIAACVAVSYAQVPVTQCTDGQPLPASFNIPQCPSSPCGLELGDVITLEIGINIVRQTTSLPVDAYVFNHSTGTDGPFTLPTGDACAALTGGASCSGTGLVPGQYMLVFPIQLVAEGVYPGNDITVRVEIDDQDDLDVACGSVSTRL